MILPRSQRGVVQLAAQLLGTLIIVLLALNFGWWIVKEENFAQVAMVIWAIGAVVAYFITCVLLLRRARAVALAAAARAVPFPAGHGGKMGGAGGSLLPESRARLRR
ncbi:MAG: hypothetical protein HYY78_05125 [Betaproteobacteria bacterium]|nr:hypothetical protein [Betaproteobacteria bacterium]